MLAVHLTTVHDPFDARILRRECVSLANDFGIDVRLLNAQGIDDSFQGVVLESFDGPGSRLRRFTLSLLRAYRAAARQRADIYHLHDPELLLVGLMLKLRGAHVIFDCHENFAEKVKGREWIPRVLRGLIARLYQLAVRLILPRFDYVIAATDGVAKSLPVSRCAVIRNVPRVSSIQSAAAMDREPGLILYTGGLSAHRGIEQVVRGLVDHCSAPWRLVVVGAEDDGVTARLGDYLRDERIECRGRVPFEEVVDLMLTSSVGIVCNQPRFDYQNALPNKLFEYMAAGLPIVCSAFPHWAELVETTGAGLTCDPEDPSSIASACTHMLRNPEEAVAMGRRGRDIVEKDLSWEREALKLFDVYRECLDER